MYHTTSSCLINGRNVAHFFDTDLPKILQIMKTDIQSNNKSIGELNEYMKQQILSYLKRRNLERPTPKMSVMYGVDTSDSICEQDSRKEENDSQVVDNDPRIEENAPLVVEQDSRTVENASRVVHNDSQIVENESVPVIEIATKAGDELTEDTETDMEAECVASFDINCATQTDSVGNAILKEMKMINELLLDTKFLLNNFQQEPRLQLSQLRDEIGSVKNTISLANQQSTDKVQTISQSTDKFSKDIKQANDALHRKLQSVHDTIKKITPSTASIVEWLVQNERSKRERATTETPQSEKSNNNGSGHERKEREQSPTEQKLDENTDTVGTTDISDKTLIIGDSILSGINRRGLKKYTH
ncbi:hypothetical protein DPMN_044446 [Dreissena polymorpha]|uniref:Uncharacterized protein n=1 Tax=Dreissena polymorpha TaxID=45954 RepID=A0A9D4D464_DREPO|nr:hypothetical protein DPMN_044446 [Dreissena polymorpha]